MSFTYIIFVIYVFYTCFDVVLTQIGDYKTYQDIVWRFPLPQCLGLEELGH